MTKKTDLVRDLLDAAKWVHEQCDPAPDYEHLFILAAIEIHRLREYEWMYKDLNDEDVDEVVDSLRLFKDD